MNEYKISCWFFGGIFIAFGLGALLTQLINEQMSNGLYFIVFGFLLMIISLFIPVEHNFVN